MGAQFDIWVSISVLAVVCLAALACSGPPELPAETAMAENPDEGPVSYEDCKIDTSWQEAFELEDRECMFISIEIAKMAYHQERIRMEIDQGFLTPGQVEDAQAMHTDYEQFKQELAFEFSFCQCAL